MEGSLTFFQHHGSYGDLEVVSLDPICASPNRSYSRFHHFVAAAYSASG